MAFANAVKMLSDYYELIGDATKLVDNLMDDSNADINDLCNLYRIRDQLSVSVLPKYNTYLDLLLLIGDVESEKDRTLVQIVAKNQEENFFNDIETFITMSKTWKFKDSRIINWQQRWYRFMSDFKEFCLLLKG